MSSMYDSFSLKSRPYGQSASPNQLIGQVDVKLGTSLCSKPWPQSDGQIPVYCNWWSQEQQNITTSTSLVHKVESNHNQGQRTKQIPNI